MTRRALVLLADGVEEMEAVIVIDVLRRAEWGVVAATLSPGEVRASRDVRLLGDAVLDDVHANDFDVLVLPGGLGGVENLMADERVLDLVRVFSEGSAKTLAAICAAPLVLQAAGILDRHEITCHPGVKDRMYTGEVDHGWPVVVDGRLVTSQGPGTAFAFALRLVSLLDDADKAVALADAMVLPHGGW